MNKHHRSFGLAAAMVLLVGVAASFGPSQSQNMGKVMGVAAGPTPSKTPKSPIQTPTLTPTPLATRPVQAASTGVRLSLDDPRMKELANELVDTAENSTTQWWQQYGYIENLDDGRGYTAGLVGFCSGTGDMLEVVTQYGTLRPGNVLAKYVPELQRLGASESDSVDGLGPNFAADWRQAAADPLFQAAQRWERDRLYFDPAVKLAKADGLHALGQFVYYDASVNMGSALYPDFLGMRNSATKVARTPAQGGDESAYIRAFLGARTALMRSGDYGPSRRVEVQIQLLGEGRLDLQFPLRFTMYPGDNFAFTQLPTPH